MEAKRLVQKSQSMKRRFHEILDENDLEVIHRVDASYSNVTWLEFHNQLLLQVERLGWTAETVGNDLLHLHNFNCGCTGFRSARNW